MSLSNSGGGIRLVISYEEYLEHHGIKGQKWGVRNGPPYPLDANKRSQSEKKAASGGSSKSPKLSGLKVKRLSKRGSDYMGSMDDETAVLIAETAVVSAIVLAPVVSRMLEGRRYKKQRKEEMKSQANVTSLDDIPKKSKKTSPEEDAKSINPNYNDGKTEGYNMNCVYCSTAFDLRRRGYDVAANYRLKPGRLEDAATFYKDAKIVKFASNDASKNQQGIVNALTSQPDGARGNLCIANFFGGHSVAYEVRGGKFMIYDGQSGDVYTQEQFQEKFISQCISFQYMRTDNLEINPSTIGEAISPDSLKKKG